MIYLNQATVPHPTSKNFLILPLHPSSSSFCSIGLEDCCCIFVEDGLAEDASFASEGYMAVDSLDMLSKIPWFC